MHVGKYTLAVLKIVFLYSFQIFLLVRHLTNWTGHNLLTDNTLKKITQDVLVRCSVESYPVTI